MKLKFLNVLAVSFLTLNSVILNVSFSQEKEKLSSNINSNISEIHPVISADGNHLYFVRSKWNDNQIENQMIWYSEKDPNGDWKKSVKMSEPFNKGDMNRIISISPDGNEIVLSYGIIKTNKSELLRIQKNNNEWKVAEILKPKSEDEEQFKNSYWGFVSYSTSGKVDDRTLYFASDRKKGYGSLDIYMSKRLDDSWMKWSEPVNLGANLNSKMFDSFYCIDAKGEYAYVVSSIEGTGNDDIYRIKLPENLKPDPVVLVYGKVINSKNSQPLDATISYNSLSDNVEAGTAKSNSFDGNYKIILPYGKKYSFQASNSGYYSISNYLDLSEISEYKEMNIDIEMRPIEIGETIRLNNIFFDFNESTLRSESYMELDRVVKLLNENPNIEIELSGHTDNVGSDEYNNNLSLNRASSVAEYIIMKGVNTQRIISKGFGKQSPVASNDSEEGRQLNRRVEFTILKNKLLFTNLNQA
ncbi:MAG: OmpA family protein [Ignavibacteria bacterium]|nr:OmpA family protein [Ignavibacteria bacterium]